MASNQPVISLVNLPATAQQRRFVLGAVAILLVAFGIVAPFAAKPLPRLDAFIPSLEAVIFMNDLITSILLFAQYSIVPSRALLALASGFLFTALIVIPHALTYPGAFASIGFLNVGLQTTIWLYIFWHLGPPVAVLAYAALKDEFRTDEGNQNSVSQIVRWSAVSATCLVCGLTWLAIAGDQLLPTIFIDSVHADPVRLAIITSFSLLIALIALAVLWVRRRTVLDYWLLLVLVALILEQTATSVLNSARFSLGFYAGRGFSLITSLVVLLLLLRETAKLYAQVARTNVLLERERASKLMNLQAVTASIAHEVKQPLGAASANSGAALRFLAMTPPNYVEVRSLLKNIQRGIHRTSEVFDSIRTLFRTGDDDQVTIDVNEIIRGTLMSFREELRDHSVEVHANLASNLPHTTGHRGQLREVVSNLLQNAIDAMETTTRRSRVLRVGTKLGRDAIVVTVEDSGQGIDPKQMDKLFEAFFTTKPRGMGLGLAICRMIIERHGGRLTASSDGMNGAQLQFTLPTDSRNKAVANAA